MGEHDHLIEEQQRYYDARAAEYEDLWFRRGRYDLGPKGNARWFAEAQQVEDAARAFAEPGGRILELACGTGIWTGLLVPNAERLLAVDSSPAMIELNEGRYGGPNVEYLQADLWEWQPPAGERFDRIFMGFFISHVPDERFTSFWSRMAEWLEPGGSVFLCDDAAGPGRPHTGTKETEGPAHAHTRILDDGREFTIVKIFYEPEELSSNLAAAGWSSDIRKTEREFIFGTARYRAGT